ncbi:MAG: S-methyl-5-thioribose-1-phosphate isomerase [Ignavibacteria bacterium]|nr:S-methyl-5-thioribose-1-phosphate isomerase [Ignavibacteria bacterium]
MNTVRPIEWRDGKVRFLDQTRLPLEEVYVETDEEVVIADAIRSLAIRGAPLVGIAAGYGFVLAFQKLKTNDVQSTIAWIERTTNLFASTRPTAVNLFWALNRMRYVVIDAAGSALEETQSRLLDEAKAIHAEDEELCRVIGQLGAHLLPAASTVLTHCNTGSLATGGSGTAQSIITTAWEQLKLRHVYIDETRPLLQGARLTAWELDKLQIPFTLITDSTAAFVMQRGMVSVVLVGADRITLNGDVANKIGTYGLAVLAKHHGIPFYVAAPTTTIDFEMASGKDIPIEQRSGAEVTSYGQKQTAPSGIDVYAPAFDITPNELVSAIITEKGVLRSPFRMAMEELKKKDLSSIVRKAVFR